MARRARTQVFYNTLVESYRDSPGNHYRAALKAGCDRQTARRAWELGWPFPWAPPIKDVLAQEQVILRAERQRAAEEAERLVAVKIAELEAEAVRAVERANAELEAAAQRKDEAEQYFSSRMMDAEQKARARYQELLEKARVDAVETQVEEAQMSKLGRKAAQGSVFIAASMFQNAKLISEKFVKAFSSADFTPKQALSAGLMLARLAKEANEAVRLSLENERLRTGQPSEIVGVSVQQQADDAPLEEMRIQAEAVLEALAEVKSKVDEKAATNGSGPVH